MLTALDLRFNDLGISGARILVSMFTIRAPEIALLVVCSFCILTNVGARSEAEHNTDSIEPGL